MHHALVADRDIPQTKEEAEREKPNWAKVAEARRSREAHDHAFHQALNSPRHFGAFIGIPNVPGEPDPETVKTYEEAKAEERERNKTLPGESKVYFLEDSILARAVKEGCGFNPSQLRRYPRLRRPSDLGTTPLRSGEVRLLLQPLFALDRRGREKRKR